MTEKNALDYSIRKFASDVGKGSELQSIKLTRFVDIDGRDFLKFNFPVCGNLSSADLMVIYSAMGGFETFVVGNAERGRRDRVIRETLGLKNVHSVPELDVPVERDSGPSARDSLSFTNTQRRAFAALPVGVSQGLVLEVAADLPLMYRLHHHAVHLSRDADFALDLNAVCRMKSLVPSFARNGYDVVKNSSGDAVRVKENNVFAHNIRSVRHNVPLFRFLYENRNGGGYLRPSYLFGSLGFLGASGRLARLFTSCSRSGRDGCGTALGEVKQYMKVRGDPSCAVSYRSVVNVFNALLSPSFFRKRVFVDATNDDIFSCWDVDGLNNDYLGYRALFRENFDRLDRIMPYSEEVYKVHEAMDERAPDDCVETGMFFEARYIRFVQKLMRRLRDDDYLRSLGIGDDVIDRLPVGSVEDSLFDMVPAGQERDMVCDLASHLESFCMPAYSRDVELYRNIA